MVKYLFLLSLIPALSLANPSGQPGATPTSFPHMMAGFASGRGHLPPFLRGISLTNDQQTQIGNLLESDKTNMESLLESNKELQTQIAELTFSETYTASEINTLIDKSVDVNRAIAIQRSHTHHQIFLLLTTEQRTAVNEKLLETPLCGQKSQDHKRPKGLQRI
ncbi:MAG: Spy/CpxP family protein refolding chaperone [Pseudomonadales bacterium]|nr:Spy/CpxP family protein refolding chaperone [Pseudomonadales bacterium]